jgi:hypothetical protein
LSLPQAERNLPALGRDPERDNVRAALQLDPVQHQHRQPHVVQAAGHQLAERLPAALHVREMDDFEIERARFSTSRPIGSCARL